MPGLVLEGGTFRPVFSCGVMDALLDNDIMFDYVIGVSAGITAMVLLLLALFFARLGDHAAEREAQRRKYIDRRHARPEEPEYRQNRRGA